MSSKARAVQSRIKFDHIVEPGTEGLGKIADRFGEAVIDDTGALNRAALGALVFADPEARADLEAITHPLIAKRTADVVAQAPRDAPA